MSANGKSNKSAAVRQSDVEAYPRKKAATLRFTCGAPRSPKLLGEGSRALFLRSDGPEDTVTSLWMSWFNERGGHRETKLADPRDAALLGESGADEEHVPAEEKARRERAREGGTGIVGYSVDAAGRRVVFTIAGRLFLTELTAEGTCAQTSEGCVDDCLAPQARTRELCLNADGVSGLAAGGEFGPVLNPRISPDGRHVLYTTGEHLEIVDIADWDVADKRRRAAELTDVHGPVWSVCDGDCPGANRTWRVGLAEFAAGEEMNRYDGFWWSPDSDAVIVETFDTVAEPLWTIADPANPFSYPTKVAAGRSGTSRSWHEPEPNINARRYPRALTANADVHLTLLKLSFDASGAYQGVEGREIAWDRAAYEYVARVNWQKGHAPLLLVQNRRQTNDQVLAVQVPAGSDGGDANVPTRVLQTHHNDQWIDIIEGTPVWTSDGRLICALNDMEADTNRLTVGELPGDADNAERGMKIEPFTPAGWNVREVLDVTDEDVLVVAQRDPVLAPEVPEPWDEEAAEHDARSFDVVSIDYQGNVTPMTSRPGVWSAVRGKAGEVVSGRMMNAANVMMMHVLHLPDTTAETLHPDSAAAGEAAGESTADRLEPSRPEEAVLAPMHTDLIGAIANNAADPGFNPNTRFVTMPGEHALLAAITLPSPGSEYAAAPSLPILMLPYGGPGFQQVMFVQSFYRDAQWWADQGFIVVTADGRGTTGRGPKWDRAIFENMKELTLDDQLEAVHGLRELVKRNAAEDGHNGCSAAADRSGIATMAGGWPVDAPQPDFDRIAMIGWSYGGFLSALAVLDAPDVFKAACAGAPPADWTLYDTHYTERYLGLDPAVYERNSIIADAPGLRRPLMLIHGFADDNVTIAHSLRLSSALMKAGRPHTFLPLVGITHMTNDPAVAENLLVLQRDFLKDHLG